MKKTGAWLTIYALEQIGVRFTFGIPGVQNTELYDELDSSNRITPILVTHEGGGAFMADAVSRLSSSVGTLVIVPAAGLTHAASGIGEACLDGIPMLVLSGGVRTDTGRHYQVHQMDLHQFMRGLTKATFRIDSHADIVPTIFRAYDIATGGEPGPVFVEIPLNLQAFAGEIPELPVYVPPQAQPVGQDSLVATAARLLTGSVHPGLFVGWGARDALPQLRELAEYLQAPVSTTLQGLSVFPGNHPLHAGFGFGPAAVPAARAAFAGCDCMIAVGTRFSEIATGSYSATVPENLVHIDINPDVFNANYAAKVALAGDAGALLDALMAAIRMLSPPRARDHGLQDLIRREKQAYRETWYATDAAGKVNPARFFDALRRQAPDDAITVLDDGNHTFLAAELFPVHGHKNLILPTDFNCMGYAVPAAIGAKLTNPELPVNVIVGDGAFAMTCMEILTATRNALGIVYYVFHDGMLSQIAQFQQLPYNRQTCTTLGGFDIEGVARATGAAYVRMPDNAAIAQAVGEAVGIASGGRPVIVDVAIDYAKKTAFTVGAGKTTFLRMPFGQKARILARAVGRRVTG
ncbi:MAG TPA: thiamine pyrophosphate-binding protein [Xanthobacteraceae bacterium]|nr:thiamine pyrophosphate-binding protein [Xanthobacteraceae bacterium]